MFRRRSEKIQNFTVANFLSFLDLGHLYLHTVLCPKETDFFIQYHDLQNEVLKTIGPQTTKLHNKNDNLGSKNP